jgi:hypothetical protein
LECFYGFIPVLIPSGPFALLEIGFVNETPDLPGIRVFFLFFESDRTIDEALGLLKLIVLIMPNGLIGQALSHSAHREEEEEKRYGSPTHHLQRTL